MAAPRAPETADDNPGGKPPREPKPAPLHNRVQGKVIYLLEAYEQERSTGGAVLPETEFVLSVDPLTVRVPDVAWVSVGRIPANGYELPRWQLETLHSLRSKRSISPSRRPWPRRRPRTPCASPGGARRSSGCWQKLNERCRCRYTSTLWAGEVTPGSVSELCQIPHETPVKHCHLRERSDTYRCCGKSLMEPALMPVGVRQHARGPHGVLDGRPPAVSGGRARRAMDPQRHDRHARTVSHRHRRHLGVQHPALVHAKRPRVRPAVIGESDGLVSNLALVMGVAGASSDDEAIIIGHRSRAAFGRWPGPLDTRQSSSNGIGLPTK